MKSADFDDEHEPTSSGQRRWRAQELRSGLKRDNLPRGQGLKPSPPKRTSSRSEKTGHRRTDQDQAKTATRGRQHFSDDHL